MLKGQYPRRFWLAWRKRMRYVLMDGNSIVLYSYAKTNFNTVAQIFGNDTVNRMFSLSLRLKEINKKNKENGSKSTKLEEAIEHQILDLKNRNDLCRLRNLERVIITLQIKQIAYLANVNFRITALSHLPSAILPTFIRHPGIGPFLVFSLQN